MDMRPLVCLDLGAAETSPPGYIPMGNAHGSAIFPLPVADASADIIRASHVLEHFPSGQVSAVLADWSRALRPGGKLKIAVPDFARIAERYMAGARQPTEAFLMGGQTAADDFHRALFDRAHLQTLMAQAGLMLIRPWESELADCASLPISLNLEGVKPHLAEISVSAVMSTPRLAFMDNMFAAIEALPSLNVKLRRYTGAYWHQCLERVIEEALREDEPDAILCLDYDSVFNRGDAAMLLQLMCCHPEADAIAAVQAGRGAAIGRLFTILGPDGRNASGVPAEVFDADLTEVATAHFGLTLLRADKLRGLPKPWFADVPAPDGSWNEGRSDADIAFWKKWAQADASLYLANRVPIGHMELTVLWPAERGPETTPVMQPIGEWRSRGKPEGIWR
ncbi:MAG TPA: methyltransferase domain-containing protein [Caulobacteraceae bacterium]|jgi:SAM-dependent methyltransferase